MKEYSIKKIFNKQSFLLLILIFIFLFPTTIYFDIKEEIKYKKGMFNKITNIFFSELTKEIDNELEKAKSYNIIKASEKVLNALKEVGAFNGYSVIENKELYNYYYKKNKLYLRIIYLPPIVKNTIRKINLDSNYIVMGFNRNIIVSNVKVEENIKEIKLINNNIIKIGRKYYYVRFNDSTYGVYPIYVLFDISMDLKSYMLNESIQ